MEMSKADLGEFIAMLCITWRQPGSSTGRDIHPGTTERTRRSDSFERIRKGLSHPSTHKIKKVV